MNFKSMLDQLVPVEMAYAHYNALRTAIDESQAGLRRGSTDTMEYLLDPSRPGNSYYNRAAGRPKASLSSASFLDLPQGIAGLEIAPAQLTPEIASQLLILGFRPAYSLCYLGIEPSARAHVEHNVVRLGPSDADQFMDLLQLQGVEFPEERRALKRDYYCTETFQCFTAKTADGKACGWATMFVDGSAAFLANTFTLPEYRCSGVHRALLAFRINAAAEMGLRTVFTDVEHASQSHHSCERSGFRTLTINTIWERQVPALVNEFYSRIGTTLRRSPHALPADV